MRFWFIKRKLLSRGFLFDREYLWVDTFRNKRVMTADSADGNEEAGL